MPTPLRGVVFVISALCVACVGDPIRREAEAVMARTTPAGAERPSLSAPTRGRMSVEYTWVVQITTPWPTYAKWAANRLSPMFTCRESAHAVECVRTVTGDTLTVRLSLLNPSDAHTVYGVFTARPD